MKQFKYIWRGSPIDFWENAIVTNEAETARVFSDMPEPSRDDIVYKTYVPGDTELVPLYMCKADNNGTIYFFCEENLPKFYGSDWEMVRP